MSDEASALSVLPHAFWCKSHLNSTKRSRYIVMVNKQYLVACSPIKLELTFSYFKFCLKCICKFMSFSLRGLSYDLNKTYLLSILFETFEVKVKKKSGGGKEKERKGKELYVNV